MSIHYPIGGSNFGVVRHCPGARYLYAIRNANNTDEGNVWSQRGTRIHKLAEMIKNGEPVPEGEETEIARGYTAALNQLAPLEEWEFEVHMAYYGDAFAVGGTADAVNRKRRIIVDLKTGSIPVEPRNPQNLFYAALVIDGWRDDSWTVGIYQNGNLKLDTYVKIEIEYAAAEIDRLTSHRDATLIPGPHCANCKCRVSRAKGIHGGKCSEWKELKEEESAF